MPFQAEAAEVPEIGGLTEVEIAEASRPSFWGRDLGLGRGFTAAATGGVCDPGCGDTTHE